MNDALAVCLCKSCADLACDLLRLAQRHRTIEIDSFRKRLPVDELHRQEFQFSQRGGVNVQIMHLTDIEVTHFAGRAHFGR